MATNLDKNSFEVELNNFIEKLIVKYPSLRGCNIHIIAKQVVSENFKKKKFEIVKGLVRIEVDSESVFKFRETEIQKIETMVLEYFSEYITDLIFKDEVCQCYNQRKLFLDLTHLTEKKDPFHILFLDVDDFKCVNDKHGHLTGSQILNQMSNLIHKHLDFNTDCLYRYGGDEFVVISKRDEVSSFAIEMSKSIKKESFSSEHGKKFKLSISTGIASYPHDADNVNSIINFADKMMYESKKQGKGKVFHIREVK